MNDRTSIIKAIIVLFLTVATSGPAQLGRQQGLLDPNVAPEKDLATLPHLNADLAKEIVAQRPLMSITNLNALLAKSLKPEQLTELYRKTFVHINLNSATREELLLIPGLGKRMAHEFEEYRPYKSLSQCRKEIGKYVDEKEVARLEQYVFIPVNLNTASDEDILSIPGLGKRMLHEFKEYRPYKSIEQFRKEIGKYVTKQELARLERYVALN
jgi:DNA uptake protein ComE-like DNA-binding protein